MNNSEKDEWNQEPIRWAPGGIMNKRDPIIPLPPPKFFTTL